MTALALKLSAKGGIDVREAFIDASFAPAKKGDIRSERRNAAREQRSWRLQIVTGCQSQETSAEAIPAALENREAFCLAPELPTSGRAI